MSLEQFHQKIKSFLPDADRGLNTVLVLLFLSGTILYLEASDIRQHKTGLIFLENAFEADFTPKNQEDGAIGGEIAASKNGTKYYYLHCSGLGRIKDENRVYFANFGEAEQAGYELAKNCEKR